MLEPIYTKINDGYDFKIVQYLKESFSIIKKYPLPFIGFSILTVIINTLFSYIPIVGNIISGFWITPSLFAGFLVVANQISEGKTPRFAQFFDGFKKMRSLALVNLTMLIYAFFFVGTAVYLVTELSTKAGIVQELMGIYQQITSTDEKPIKIIAILSFFVVLLPISMLALFTLSSPFIIFENMDFWEAMQNSRKLVWKKIIYYTLIFLFVVAFIMVISFGVSYILQPILLGTEDATTQSNIYTITALQELLKSNDGKSIGIVLLMAFIPKFIIGLFTPLFYTFIYAIYKDMATEQSVEEDAL